MNALELTAAALAIRCPFCGVPPRRPCRSRSSPYGRTPGGRKTRRPHLRRTVAVQPPRERNPGAMTLEEARQHTGETVIYSPDPGRYETGTIARVGRIYVHVRYGGGRVQATRPEALTLMRGITLAEHFRFELAESGEPGPAGEDA